MSEHYVVTGATGFLGRRLCGHLSALGHQVTALARPSSDVAPLDGTGARVRRVDLLDADELAPVLRGADRVVHLAGTKRGRGPMDWRATNIAPTRALVGVLAGLAEPPRLVLCSALAASGPSEPGRPRAETDREQPVSWHGRSKLAAERAVRTRADRIPAVVLRAPLVHGPGDPSFLPGLVRMMRRGIAPRLSRDMPEWSLLHVDDLCRGLVAAAEQGTVLDRTDPLSGVYFLADAHHYTWPELCAVAAEALGRRIPRCPQLPETAAMVSARLASAPARMRGRRPALTPEVVRELHHPVWTCSTERAARFLNFRAQHDFSSGMTDFLAAGGTQEPAERVRRIG